MLGQDREIVTTDGSTGVVSIHDGLRVKEKGLKDHLNYDWYRRVCFTEHFLSADTDLDKYSKSRYWELGDFVKKQYEVEEIFGKEEVKIKFSRQGNVFIQDISYPLKVTKTFTISGVKSEFDVEWVVENTGDKRLELWMGIENNISLLAGNSPKE